MERIDKISEGLKELREDCEAMNKVGVSKEILVAWLCYKMKISKKAANKFLENYKNFFDELIIKDEIDQI